MYLISILEIILLAITSLINNNNLKKSTKIKINKICVDDLKPFPEWHQYTFGMKTVFFFHLRNGVYTIDLEHTLST